MTIARLTFREKSPDICWQKQLRDRFLDEGCPLDAPIDLKSSRVRKVSRRFAEQIILKYEWLGTMAATGWHYGIFFGLHCAGVCCYASGSPTGGVNTHKMFGIESSQLGVLARGACVHWSPLGTNSRLVSRSVKMFCEESGCKVVIAYSDSDAGEIGTIYQACNWTYIGKGSSTRQWISPKGRVMDQKLPYDLKRKFSGTRRKYVELLRLKGWIEQDSNPKNRYVFAYDKDIKRQVERMKKPYPKRPSSIVSDASTFQVEEGSANLTDGLSY